MKRELLPQFDALVEPRSAWREALVDPVEQLYRRRGWLDRHCSATSTLVMRLESTGIAFRCASLIVLGRALGQDTGYQVRLDLPGRCMQRVSNVGTWPS